MASWCRCNASTSRSRVSATSVNTIRQVHANLNPDLKVIGLLRVMFDARITLQQQVSEQLKSHFGTRFSTPSFRATCGWPRPRATAYPAWYSTPLPKAPRLLSNSRAKWHSASKQWNRCRISRRPCEAGVRSGPSVSDRGHPAERQCRFRPLVRKASAPAASSCRCDRLDVSLEGNLADCPRACVRRLVLNSVCG